MLGSKTINFCEQSKEHQANDSNSRLIPLVKNSPKLSSVTTATQNHLQTHQSLMSCFTRGIKTTPRRAKQTTGISEMLDSANGCAAAPDAALDPNWDNSAGQEGVRVPLKCRNEEIPAQFLVTES